MCICSNTSFVTPQEVTVQIFEQRMVVIQNKFLSIVFLEESVGDGGKERDIIYHLVMPVFSRSAHSEQQDCRTRHEWLSDILGNSDYRISGRKKFFLLKMSGACKKVQAKNACWAEN